MNSAQHLKKPSESLLGRVLGSSHQALCGSGIQILKLHIEEPQIKGLT